MYIAIADRAQTGTSPVPASVSPRVSTQPLPPGPGWHDVIGPGCRHFGPSTITGDGSPPQSDGWHATRGGWTGDNCDGIAQWTVTTGRLNFWQDTQTYAFRPGYPTTCRLSAYIADTIYSGGVAAYDIHPDTVSEDNLLTTATIDQSKNRGLWVDLARVRTPDGILKIVLADRPRATQGVYPVTASALRARCD